VNSQLCIFFSIILLYSLFFSKKIHDYHNINVLVYYNDSVVILLFHLSSGTTTACRSIPHSRNNEILTAFHPPVTTSPVSPRLQESTDNRMMQLQQQNQQQQQQNGGGCSRTTPLPPRSRSNETCVAFTPVTIKKEAGSTPCQVAEVTTSRGTAAAAVTVATASVTPNSPLAANQGTKVAVSNAPMSPAIHHHTIPLTTIKTEPISEPIECNTRRDSFNNNNQHSDVVHSQIPPNNGKYTTVFF
jgi:hypothetical protein